MRKKYASKILLSDFNICKSSFLESIEDYDKLKSYKRKKIYSQDHVDEIRRRVEGIKDV